MEALNVAFLVVGIVLIGLGYARGRGPYARMRALEASAENVRRYESWRGGHRGPGPGASGADLMHEQLRRETRRWTGLAILGFLLVFAAFLIR